MYIEVSTSDGKNSNDDFAKEKEMLILIAKNMNRLKPKENFETKNKSMYRWQKCEENLQQQS